MYLKAFALVAAFCGFFALFTVEVSAQAGERPNGAPTNSIMVTPATLSFALGKGEQGAQLLTVRNTTDRKYQLQLKTVDWTRDSLGGHSYFENGTDQSCARWLKFDKEFLEMEPGQVATVTVTMKLPDSSSAVSEMKWTMVLLRTTEEKLVPGGDAKLAFATTQTMAIGIHIYQTPTDITQKEVKMLAFEPRSAQVNSYRIRSKNTGGIQLSCKYTMELTSLTNGEKFTLNSKVIPLFPKQERVVDFEIPTNVPKGKYSVVAMIDASDDDIPIEAVEREIMVK